MPVFGNLWNASQLNTFKHLVRSYDLLASYLFNNYRGYLVAKPIIKDGIRRSFYLGNNGLIDMLAPIYFHLNPSKETKKTDIFEKNMPAILRGFFADEIWQVFRLEVKGPESKEKIDKLLIQLLGIDFEKHSPQLPPLFEKEADPEQIKFYDQAHFNFGFLEQFIKTKGLHVK